MPKLWPWQHDRHERELDAELRDHLERLTADYRRTGLSEPEARRRAAAMFGGFEQVKEYCRDVRPGAWIRDAVTDLLLVAIGVYGTLEYAAARRTREMGVRLALGAQRRDIMRRLLAGALTPIGLGITAGVPLALGAGYLIRTTLYGVSAGDLQTYAAATVLLLAAGLVAALGPARRAATTDPMVALRDQ